MNNELPNDWWNYGINPILGYRYNPEGKRFHLNTKNSNNENPKTKPKIPISRE